jgi:hypothetical protein
MSVLRMSSGRRVAVALGVSALLWLALFWAIG